jgi:geranylgeranyl diphosphate synthase type II
VYTVTAGQHADVSFASRVVMPGTAEIVAMTEKKTASYSFMAPLAGGAVLAGADADTVQSLRDFGRHVGVAFQLRDDVLGVFGVEKLTGKSVLSDLREGKLTLLIAAASPSARWREVMPLFGRADLTEADAAILRAALEDVGARAFVESAIREQATLAGDILHRSELPDELKTRLSEVLRRCVERDW